MCSFPFVVIRRRIKSIKPEENSSMRHNISGFFSSFLPKGGLYWHKREEQCVFYCESRGEQQKITDMQEHKHHQDQKNDISIYSVRGKL
jgi:hypothetical protein